MKRSSSQNHNESEKKKKSSEVFTWIWRHESPADVYVGYRSSDDLGDGSVKKSVELLNVKLAAFDLDGTLCVTKTGGPFAKHGDDFKLFSDQLPDKFRRLKDTHEIVIFTNQLGIFYKKTNIEETKKRIEGVINCLGHDFNCRVFIAANENAYRKPRKGMFDMLCSSHDLDLDSSFFVGDAAGRDKTKERKKDHSNSDFLFALNTGLNFLTPEQFLAIQDFVPQTMKSLHEANLQSLPQPAFNAVQEKEKDKFRATLTSQVDTFIMSSLDDFRKYLQDFIGDKEKILIVMTGIPASGKSWVVNNCLPEFDIISRDELGSMEKCQKQFKLLFEKKSVKVVVDNTNTKVEDRRVWIQMAKERKVDEILSIFLDLSIDQCRHNNSYRRLLRLKEEKDGKKVATVPSFVLNNMAKSLVTPDLKEGFSLIVRITTNFPVLRNRETDNLYYQFL